jgi:hypothetical protein
MAILEVSLGHSNSIVPGLQTALIAGVVLFGLNWIREIVTARLKRRHDAEVVAFSLALQLDKLISQCSDVVNDEGEEDRDTGEWHAMKKFPTLAFPENTNWSSLQRKFQYRIRWLPNELDTAVHAIQEAAEIGGPPDYYEYFQERQIRAAEIGLEALSIRQRLTDKYGVRPFDRGKWDPKDEFKAKIAVIERSRDAAKIPWEIPDAFKPKIPMEELEKRRAALGSALEIAKAKAGVR